MKKLNLWAIAIFSAANIGFFLWGHFDNELNYNARIRALEYQHTRDSLVNDTVKLNNTELRAENGWLWSQVDKESED